MWINPKFKDQVEQPKPPAENGERLATFARGDQAEMRVNLSTYERHDFISLRLWKLGPDGSWYPTKTGCSVRISEAAALSEALSAVASGTGRPDRARPAARPSSPVQPRRQPRGRGPWDPAKLAPATRPTREFDEFESP